MRKLKSIILLLFALGSISACDSLLSANSELRPLNPPFMPGVPTGGPPEFQEGWKDGCDTGKAQHGDDIYRTSYKFYQNPDLITNPIYYKAWKDGENYCRTYIFEYVHRSTYVYCSVDGLANECADNDKTPGPFMGGQTGDDIGNGVFGGGGAGMSSVMGGAKSGTGAGITGIIGSGEDTPGFGGGSDSSIFGNW